MWKASWNLKVQNFIHTELTQCRTQAQLKHSTARKEKVVELEGTYIKLIKKKEKKDEAGEAKIINLFNGFA